MLELHQPILFQDYCQTVIVETSKNTKIHLIHRLEVEIRNAVFMAVKPTIHQN